MDPDEYIKKFGKDEFLKYIKDNQKDVYAFLYFNAFKEAPLNKVIKGIKNCGLITYIFSYL